MPYSGNSHKSRQEAGTKSDSRKAKKETVRDGKKGVGKQSRILYSKERTEKREYKRLKWKGTVSNLAYSGRRQQAEHKNTKHHRGVNSVNSSLGS